MPNITCKECRRFKRCMESSRLYPCKDFARRNEAEKKLRKCENETKT